MAWKFLLPPALSLYCSKRDLVGELVTAARARGTHRGDWNSHGVFTARGNALYWLAQHWTGETLTFVGLECRVENATLLSTGAKVQVRQTNDRVVLTGLPVEAPDPVCLVIRMDFDRQPVINQTGGQRVPHPHYDPCPSDIALGWAGIIILTPSPLHETIKLTVGDLIALLKFFTETAWTLLCGLGSIVRGLFFPFWNLLPQMVRVPSSRVKQVVVAPLAVLVIVVSLTSIIRSQITPTSKPNLVPFEARGEVAAAETVKMLGGNGRIVVWQQAMGLSKSPVFRAQQEAFNRTLKESPGIVIIAVAEEEAVAEQPMSAVLGMGVLPAARFLELLNKYHTVDAIVLFGAVPELKGDDFRQLPTRRPKILAVVNAQPPRRLLFEEDVLQAAIVPRFQGTGSTNEPTSRREWFDRYFMVVTTKTASQLPY